MGVGLGGPRCSKCKKMKLISASAVVLSCLTSYVSTIVSATGGSLIFVILDSDTD